MTIVSLTATLKPTTAGKAMVTQAMFLKGSHFVGAAVLLRQHNGNPHVILHLLCQGMEILQKSLLLSENYDVYHPKLRRFGHDLAKGADELSKVYKFRRTSGNLKTELDQLNTFYTKHLLRYASIADVLIDPVSLRYELVLRRCAALIKFGSKKLNVP